VRGVPHHDHRPCGGRADPARDVLVANAERGHPRSRISSIGSLLDGHDTPRRCVILGTYPITASSASISVRDRSGCELNEQLVGDLRARHPEALERLLDEYGRLLQGVAFHILRSHADAEEVVIDTMVTAWERIGSLRDPGALRPWLLRIAARHALGRRRRAVPSLTLLAGAAATTSGEADPDRMALAEALDGLPPRMRACLSLHYYAGLSVAETATALGISPNTVKFHLKSGLDRLREALDIEPMRVRQTRTEA
jgi:RNA polymerase sigma-70 factor (ECF subfamily)